MIGFVRRRLSYANVVATFALVFAMTGGAFAVTGGSHGGGHDSRATTAAAKKKKGRSSTGLRGPRGPRGPAGPAGATGPQGPAGPEGKAGANGKDGANGTTGTNGTNGKSVVVVGAAASCPAGGSSIEVEGSGVKHNVCNGNPAEYPEVLPSGHTLTGHWSAVGYGTAGVPNPGTGFVVGSVTYPIALGKEPAHSELLEESATPTAGCPGSVGKPTAERGWLCVYTAASKNVALFNSLQEVDATGWRFQAFTKEAGSSYSYGSWAVTAD